MLTCQKIPTLFEKDVSEILGLVDLIYAENTPEETKVAAMKEVKKAEGTLRKAWSMLNENIRAGRRLRLEVQGFEDEDHTEEDRTEDAGSNSEDAGAEDDEDGNGSTTDGEDGWDDWNLNNDCGVSYSYSITILAEAVSKMTKAISSLNGPGTSMADSFLSSDEETKGLVELVVQIQREIVPGEHDMRGIQAVKGQWDDTDDMYEELYEG